MFLIDAAMSYCDRRPLLCPFLSRQRAPAIVEDSFPADSPSGRPGRRRHRETARAGRQSRQRASFARRNGRENVIRGGFAAESLLYLLWKPEEPLDLLDRRLT